MWSKYHSLCTSEHFKQEWKYFLNKSVQSVLLPTFYQHLTDLILVEVSLTYEEKNALAGYVPRALRKKLEKSAHPLKEELVLCLVEMTEGDRGIDESEDWVNSVDRGGLKHIRTDLSPSEKPQEKTIDCACTTYILVFIKVIAPSVISKGWTPAHRANYT